MKILAVDDDPIILELLVQFVTALGGHEITTALSGKEAIETLKQQNSKFDCCLFDIQMPEMDGIALTKKLRATAKYADMPILMLTAMADKRYIDAAFAAGATDYVTKPLDLTELKVRLNHVEGLIEKRQSRTQKIFATQAVQEPGEIVGIFEPFSIYDVENVIDYMAMENYVAQLSRSALFGSSTFAFTVREVDMYFEGQTSFEFYSLISDVAEVISDTFEGHQYLMAYAGNGTFVCVTESGWRPEPASLMEAINLSLATTELFSNDGTRLHPRVSAGEAVRLMWRSGSSVMDALAQAHASAEEAAAAHLQNSADFFEIGQTA